MEKQEMSLKNIETIKGNVLIAEFEGRLFYGRYLIGCYGEATLNNYPEMKYHSSWVWLMPVLEKIRDIAEMKTIGDTIRFLWSWYYNVDNNDFNSINDLWLAVVEFIKWYNGKESKG